MERTRCLEGGFGRWWLVHKRRKSGVGASMCQAAPRPIRHEAKAAVRSSFHRGPSRKAATEAGSTALLGAPMPSPMRIAVSSLLATANAQILYQREDAPQSMEEQIAAVVMMALMVGTVLGLFCLLRYKQAEYAVFLEEQEKKEAAEAAKKKS